MALAGSIKHQLHRSSFFISSFHQSLHCASSVSLHAGSRMTSWIRSVPNQSLIHENTSIRERPLVSSSEVSGSADVSVYTFRLLSGTRAILRDEIYIDFSVSVFVARSRTPSIPGTVARRDERILVALDFINCY